ncbi:MAG TPA: hypothetical protein VLA67_00890 [Nitrospiraceae bacterium]|nr:hypothetical protein [Nitrospiraceae bacterium]
MTEEDVAAHKLIAQFMSVSTKLEKYLQEGKPLTPLQLEINFSNDIRSPYLP